MIVAVLEKLHYRIHLLERICITSEDSGEQREAKNKASLAYIKK